MVCGIALLAPELDTVVELPLPFIPDLLTVLGIDVLVAVFVPPLELPLAIFSALLMTLMVEGLNGLVT